MKIALVISSLGPGGAERVISGMSSWWAKHDRDVTLITLSPKDSDFYPIHPDVKRVALDVMTESSSLLSAIVSNFRRALVLRRAIRQLNPDVVISFVDKTNVLTLVATLGMKVPVIVSERTSPDKHDIGGIWSWARRLTYPRAALVVVQSAGVFDWVVENINSCASKTLVIPNPLCEGGTEASGASDSPIDLTGGGAASKTIISAGSMVPHKGFDLLLKAFARVADKHGEWRLVIFGDGPERENLKSLAEDFGISKRVFMPGVVKNLSEFFRRADMYVLPSRFEGFPNALVEAMSCGLPAICFDCSGSMRDIVREGVNGILVHPEDIGELAQAMDKLMGDENLRGYLACNASEVATRLNIDNIMARWEKIICGLKTRVCAGEKAA